MAQERLITVKMSESSARATLRAVQDDPDRSKWGQHQWIRSDAVIELTEALEATKEDES